jgi:hypothetical protein
MLRYYAIDDDLYGLSEIEPVKGLQKAINALLCQYVDEINQQLYSPIAIGPGVRQHTLEWGKGARWVMNNPMTDFRLVESRSNAAQFFNNTYSVLVAAMMNALGESSLGVSNVDRYQNDKTATEVKQLQQQRNARDSFNQIFLADSIKRMMQLWHSMNQLLLFSDPQKQHFILRVVGKEYLDYLTDKGLDSTTSISDEALSTLVEAQQVLDEKSQEAIKPTDFSSIKYPVTYKEDGEEVTKPKLMLDDDGKTGELIVTPDDLTGTFDFVVDVQPMQSSAEDDRKQAQQQAVSIMITNPNVPLLLQQEGVKPKFKQLFVDWLEAQGFSDADKYFETIPQNPAPAGGPQGGMSPDMAAAAMGGNQGGQPGQGGFQTPFGYKVPLPNQFMWTPGSGGGQ